MTADKGHDPAGAKRRWKEFLSDNRLNTTQQRELIVDYFLKSTDHLSIDELLAKVRKKSPKVGYATVYRTMKLLVEAGIATQRQFGDGQARYELAGEHHDHLICTKCGKIVEFEDDKIEALQESIADRFGFVLKRHRHEMYGICPDCQ